MQVKKFFNLDVYLTVEIRKNSLFFFELFDSKGNLISVFEIPIFDFVKLSDRLGLSKACEYINRQLFMKLKK